MRIEIAGRKREYFCTCGIIEVMSFSKERIANDNDCVVAHFAK